MHSNQPDTPPHPRIFAYDFSNPSHLKHMCLRITPNNGMPEILRAQLGLSLTGGPGVSSRKFVENDPSVLVYFVGNLPSFVLEL